MDRNGALRDERVGDIDRQSLSPRTVEDVIVELAGVAGVQLINGRTLIRRENQPELISSRTVNIKWTKRGIGDAAAGCIAGVLAPVVFVTRVRIAGVAVVAVKRRTQSAFSLPNKSLGHYILCRHRTRHHRPWQG